MRVFELISELQKMDQNLDVMYLGDGPDYDLDNVEVVEERSFSFYRGGPDETVVVLS